MSLRPDEIMTVVDRHLFPALKAASDELTASGTDRNLRLITTATLLMNTAVSALSLAGLSRRDQAELLYTLADQSAAPPARASQAEMRRLR